MYRIVVVIGLAVVQWVLTFALIAARTQRYQPASSRSGDRYTMSQEQQEYVEKASDFEAPESDFEAEFSLEDTQVPDHPVVVDVDGLGKASAWIVAWELVEDMQDEGEQYELDASLVASLIQEHYKSPSFDGLTAEKVRSMKISAPDALLGAIMPGMQTQMNPDGSAQVDTKNV